MKTFLICFAFFLLTGTALAQDSTSTASINIMNDSLRPKSLIVEIVTVAGKCCESGDILIKDISLPLVEPGDILAISCTGAYGYTMASNYNRLPRPAVVLVRDGQADIIVRRETYEDLLRQEALPRRLRDNGNSFKKGVI